MPIQDLPVANSVGCTCYHHGLPDPCDSARCPAAPDLTDDAPIGVARMFADADA